MDGVPGDANKTNLKIATVDVGTNTALLLIAEVDATGAIHPLEEQQRFIRLGKGLDQRRVIDSDGLERCLNALSEYRTIIDHHAVNRVVACGTSAMRDAENQRLVVKTIEKATGIYVEVLSGEEEARWTFEGGRMVFGTQPPASMVVVDIGGGSTELIFGQGETIDRSISLDVGSVRMTERFAKSDPVTTEEEHAMRAHIRNEFSRVDGSGAAGIMMVGVAGTITTLAAIMQELDEYDPARINGFVLRREHLRSLLEILQANTVEQRKQLKGLQAPRADVIFAGGIILDEAMNRLQADRLTVSNYGLRYGLIRKAIR